MGMRFYAIAKGIASEAQTTFTDSGTLTITFAGDGAGSVSGVGDKGSTFACAPNCSPSFEKTEKVLLTATPATGSTFAGWSSQDKNFSCPGLGTCEVHMTENRSVTAKFEETEAKATPIVTVTGAPSTMTASRMRPPRRRR